MMAKNDWINLAGRVLSGRVSAVTGHIIHREDQTIDLINQAEDPMENFKAFGLGFTGDDIFIPYAKTVISYVRIIGFAMALTAMVFIIIRYFITPNPMRREMMKSRAITMGILIMLLGAALVIADLFYEFATSIVGG